MYLLLLIAGEWLHFVAVIHFFLIIDLYCSKFLKNIFKQFE